MVAQYDKQWPLPKALWLTFSAKARAQVAGGVGPKTDLIVVTPGKIDYATEDQISSLMSVFGRVARKESEANDEAVAVLEGHIAAAAEAAQNKDRDASGSPPPARPEPGAEGEEAPSQPSPFGDMQSVGDTGAVEATTSSSRPAGPSHWSRPDADSS
jgi:hypothetical protein